LFFSVEHLREAKSWFEKLRGNGRLSANKTFQSYIGGFCFDQRAALPDAKSFIVFAIPEKLHFITFHHQGARYDIKIPTGYVDSGLTGDIIRKQIRSDILRDPRKKLKGRVRLPLKTLAVRSGLAEYGRNNITYVNGYGSYHALYGLYTDKELEDNWGPMKMLRLCKGCSVCTRECPTRCIRPSNFVIDEGRCVALYSELPGIMPGWIKPDAHNALIGCLKCQFDCPANAEGARNIEKIAELTEEETDFILKQGTDKEIYKRILEKLKVFPYAEDLAYFSRNLKLVMANTRAV
jgi:epoxyqueuosine reductase